MPLFTPHFTPGSLSALRSRLLIPTARTGFTLPGGRLPNADGNLPPESIGDGAGSPIDAPPGTDGDAGGAGAGEEAPPADSVPEPESEESLFSRALSWPKENPGKAIAVVALLLAAYTAAYKLGKRRKNRRRR